MYFNLHAQASACRSLQFAAFFPPLILGCIESNAI